MNFFPNSCLYIQAYQCLADAENRRLNAHAVPCIQVIVEAT